MPPRKPKPVPVAPLNRFDLLPGIIVSLAAATLYFLTAARDIVVGDTGELTTAAITLGIPHAPGYPLFVLLGHLFTFLPFGSLAFRVSLLSVACGAAAVGLTYATSLRLTRSRYAAAAAAIVLALTPLFWKWSLVAEVFPVNNFLASLLIFLLARWDETPERTPFLVAAAFVTGVAFTNHQTIVLLAPAIVYLLWRHREPLLKKPMTIAYCALVLIAGFLPYAYVPWAAARQPVINWGNARDFRGVIGLIRRESYGTGHLVSAPGFAGGSAGDRIVELLTSFQVLTAVLILLGAYAAFRKRRSWFWFSAIAFAVAGPAFIAYANMNLAAPSAPWVLHRFFLLPYVVLAPLVAFGVTQLARVAGDRRAVWVSIIVVAIAAAVSLPKYRALDQSRNHIASRFAEDLLDSVDRNGVLLAGGDEVTLPLLYAQNVEHYRTDVTLLLIPLFPGDWYLQELRARYPAIAIPFTHFGPNAGTTKALVDANPTRTFFVAGDLLDESLQGSYWFYQRGLVTVVEPMAKDVMLSRMIADNEQLLRRFHIPKASDIDWETFEAGVLARYSSPAFRVAQECEHGHRDADARKWYERALGIDPRLDMARDALARLAVSR